MSRSSQHLTLSGRYVAAVGALRQAHPHAGTALTTLRRDYAEAMSAFRARHAEGLAAYRALSAADQQAFITNIVAKACQPATTNLEGHAS